jgi:ankyrin repeat protein
MRFRNKPKMPPGRVAQQQPRSASPLPQQQHEQERQPKEPKAKILLSSYETTPTHDLVRITPDEFLEAAKNGNLRKVMLCIDKGIDVEVKASGGYTALHFSTYYGHLDIVKYLIETCNVDKEAKTDEGYSSSTGNDGYTALHLASSIGNLVIVKYLIETHQVDIEAATNGGSTALHLASSNGNLMVVKYLIETCHVDIEAKTIYGSTALHLAGLYGHLEIVQYLIETYQVDEEAKTYDGQTAYDLALTNGKINIIEYLKERRTKSTVELVESMPSEDKEKRIEDFLDAAKQGNLDKVKTYVNSGIDKEAKSNRGYTSLHLAGDNGHLEIVEYLVEICCADSEAKSNGGWTVLPNSGAVSLPTNVLTNTYNLNSQSSFAYELNDGGMTKLQDDNQNLLDMLTQFGSSVQFIEERRDIVDMIVVEKCITIKEQAEQVAILSSPNHRDFYLLFQRKLKCMIKSCESLSSGMVGVKNGDMRSFASRTIHETGCNVLKETTLGFLVGSAVEWS